MPAGMAIPPHLRKQLVDHALADSPNECCGVVGVRRGAPRQAASVLAATNLAASPLRFEIDGLEVLRLIEQIDSEGLELGAIYHSHTRTAPYPSQTDINFAAGWPGVEWVILGVADPESPEVRSYLIDKGQVQEVAIAADEVAI
ncbi:MAG TPA: M67 family metallopeptidase [Solirubrobacteraceae bacterium]|jgi:proteasome lid subunit RPN8/RPN11|nr:M67 family metallopeptidase [Solirubrobacteraceae bacterium]